MVERYISLYSTAGEVLAKVRTELKASDDKLKAKLFHQLPADKQNGVDLTNVDFTGQTLHNCRNCNFGSATLVGTTLINPAGSSFREANLTGTNFEGDCRDMYLSNIWPRGIDCSQADGMIIGGYSVDGEPLIAHMRSKNWWVFTIYQGRQLYFAFDEIKAVTYGLADPVFTTRLTEMIGDMKDRMIQATMRVQEIYNKAGNSNMAERAADASRNSVSPAKLDVADDISRTLAGFMQNKSERSISEIKQMKAENSGDVLRQ